MNSFKEKFKIAKILASLFTHSSTPEEEKNYHAWLDENPEHQKIADRILNKETYEENSRLIKSFSSQKAWEKVYPLLGNDQSRIVFSWKRSLKYAALILLLIIPASFLIYNWAIGEQIGEIMPGTRGGEIILSNGNTLRIPEGVFPEGATEVFVIDSKGINYQTSANKTQVKEIKNTLRTLHGMECHIVLSDGTKVHLNAESQLTYPICFSSKERIVQVEGEAYFDVAPDKEHPFVVKTSHTSIQVTGTSFNVRAYADEEIESTTLISGGVKISSGNEVFELIPNQHYTYNKKTNTNTVTNVNTELYTSWESGSFIFLNVPLENVMSYLSKWYGFKYTFEDETAKQVRIGASLNRYKNMNPIIDMITELNLVNIKQREGILHISYKQ
ncbi:FecR family protein [Bacteroides caecimuris]|uniref:FecR family protein n=1 Tax=Bacteroides caecimuris TaxID=1796613 RepID=UPI0026580D80|nr:FecR family protein [Bacteroides caecimuris]